MILIPQIFYVMANENVYYKPKQLELLLPVLSKFVRLVGQSDIFS